MGWARRRETYLIGLCVISLVLAIIVFVTARIWQLDCLAGIGVAGGLAILIVALPRNGNGDKT